MSNRVFNQARARKIGGGFIVFAEFELYNDVGVNIAPLGTATSTSSQAAGFPDRAIDGSSDNVYQNDPALNSVFISLGDGEQIWTLTMDRPYSQAELDRVGVLARSVATLHESMAIELLSTDGQPPLLLGITDDSSYQTFSVPIPSLLDITVRSINILVVITEVMGSISYRITLEGPTGGEVTKVSDTARLIHNLIGIEPQTQYIIRLYSDTGTGYELSEETTVATLVNNASNYEVTDFENEGLVNISPLIGENLDLVINDIFNTGELLAVSLPSNPSLKSHFVKRGETLSIKDKESIFLPFSPSTGSGQASNVLLSDDSTTVPVAYDELSNNITINSNTFSIGNIFILDGRKVTIYEY